MEAARSRRCRSNDSATLLDMLSNLFYFSPLPVYRLPGHDVDCDAEDDEAKQVSRLRLYIRSLALFYPPTASPRADPTPALFRFTYGGSSRRTNPPHTSTPFSNIASTTTTCRSVQAPRPPPPRPSPSHFVVSSRRLLLRFLASPSRSMSLVFLISFPFAPPLHCCKLPLAVIGSEEEREGKCIRERCIFRARDTCEKIRFSTKELLDVIRWALCFS